MPATVLASTIAGVALADELAPDALDDDLVAQRLIRRIWIAAGLLELLYVAMIVWDQTDEARKAQLRARVRAVLRCAKCEERKARRREVNRGIYEAGEWLEAQAAGDG